MDKSKLGQTGTRSKDLSQSKTLPVGSKTMTNGQSTMKSGDPQKKSELSSEEMIMEKVIQSVEVVRLGKVFEQLRTAQLSGNNKQGGNTNNASETNVNNSNNFNGSGTQKVNKNDDKGTQNVSSSNSADGNDFFTAKDVAIILNDLGYEASKAEVEQMIWEVDENLDNKINRYEFELMYRRCRHDSTGLEPRNLYNLVQFLMYLKSDPNQSSSSSSNGNASYVNTKSTNAEKKTITVEDTLELLYVRYGRLSLDREIEEIFGKDEKNAQGEEKSITLKEYLEKQRKRDFTERKSLEEERKKVKMPEENDKSRRF